MRDALTGVPMPSPEGAEPPVSHICSECESQGHSCVRRREAALPEPPLNAIGEVLAFTVREAGDGYECIVCGNDPRAHEPECEAEEVRRWMEGRAALPEPSLDVTDDVLRLMLADVARLDPNVGHGCIRRIEVIELIEEARRRLRGTGG
jgi:hypothetical protein